jgi:hypothetical protein
VQLEIGATGLAVGSLDLPIERGCGEIRAQYLFSGAEGCPVGWGASRRALQTHGGSR